MMKRITLALSLAVGLLCASQAQVMMLFSQDSLTGIVSPLDVDSLFYWFAADVGVTDSLGGAIATDEGVGTWNDLSGNGHHVTQSTNGARPVYKATGGPGSKSCIQFDGTNDFLASAAHWWGSDDISIFIVMKYANATRNTAEFLLSKRMSGASSWDLLGLPLASNYRERFLIAKDSALSNYFEIHTPNNYKHTTWKLKVRRSDGAGITAGTNVEFFDDGAEITTQRLNTVGLPDGTIANCRTPLDIGVFLSGSAPQLFLQGSISEIIVYSRALSATERTAIENYLNKKYGLY